MSIKSRIAELVKREIERFERGQTQLSEKTEIGRRRLGVLASGSANHLVFDELDALDRYFRRLPGGIGLLERLTMTGDAMDLLSAYQKVVIYVGSRRPIAQHDYIDAWDFRACAALLQAFYLRGRRVPPELRNIVFHSRDQALDAIKRERDCAVISIGSPRSCAMSEILLAEIHAVPKEYCFRGESLRTVKPPFCFEWPRTGDSHPFTSCFEVPPAVAARSNEPREAGSGAALHWNGTRHPVEPNRDFGVVSLRTVSDAVTYVVAGGCSGLGTLAAVDCLAKGLKHIDIAVQPSPMRRAETTAVAIQVGTRSRVSENGNHDGYDARFPGKWEVLR